MRLTSAVSVELLWIVFGKRLAVSADCRGCVRWQEPLERQTPGRFIFVDVGDESGIQVPDE